MLKRRLSSSPSAAVSSSLAGVSTTTTTTTTTTVSERGVREVGGAAGSTSSLSSSLSTHDDQYHHFKSDHINNNSAAGSAAAPGAIIVSPRRRRPTTTTHSPYDGKRCAESDEACFDELYDIFYLGQNARHLLNARIEILKSGMIFSVIWSEEGRIRGKEFGSIPKRDLLLCLFGERFSKGDENVLKSVVLSLECFELVIEALEAWGFEDDYLKLASNKNNKEKEFIFDTQKRNCFKCQIFVARAFATYQVLNKTESFGGSLESKIKVCLDFMEDNVRVVNKIELDRLQQEQEKRTSTNKDNVDDDEEIKKGEAVVDEKEKDMFKQYGRHYWTDGEREKLAEGLAVYGNDDNNNYYEYHYNNLSKFMKYRRDWQLRGYMQRNADKIKELSKKYKSAKPTIRTAATPWTDEEHGKLCEGYALYRNDYITIEGYIRTRSASQIEIMLIKNADIFNDEFNFNLGCDSTLPVELYHVLNIAPHEGFDHIISWTNWNKETKCKSFKIHDKEKFEEKVWPKYSHDKMEPKLFYLLLNHFHFTQIADGSYYNDVFCKGNIKQCIALRRKFAAEVNLMDIKRIRVVVDGVIDSLLPFNLIHRKHTLAKLSERRKATDDIRTEKSNEDIIIGESNGAWTKPKKRKKISESEPIISESKPARYVQTIQRQYNVSRSRKFPRELHNLLEDSEEVGYTDFIHWLPSGDSFAITNVVLFSNSILAMRCVRKSCKTFSSFEGSLICFGFEKIVCNDTEGSYRYRHPYFVRGQVKILDLVKPVQNYSYVTKSARKKFNNANTITSVTDTSSTNERVGFSTTSEALLRLPETEDLDLPSTGATAHVLVTTINTNKDEEDNNHAPVAVITTTFPIPLLPPPLHNPARAFGTIGIGCAHTNDSGIASVASASYTDDIKCANAFSNINNKLNDNNCNNNNVSDVLVNANTTTNNTALVVRMSDDQPTQKKRKSISLSSLDPTSKESERKGPPKKCFRDISEMVLAQGMRLSHPNDPKHLNSLHCFVRSTLLEVFVLKPGSFSSSKQHNVVGIRCTQCGTISKKERGKEKMAVFFPKSVRDLYRGVCTWQRLHFGTCEHMPEEYKEKYKIYKETDLTRGRKSHWINSAYEMGLRDVNSDRIGVTYDPNSAIDYTTCPFGNPRKCDTTPKNVPNFASVASTITITAKKNTAKTKKAINEKLEVTTLAGSYDDNDNNSSTTSIVTAVAKGQRNQLQKHVREVNQEIFGVDHDFELFGMELDDTITEYDRTTSAAAVKKKANDTELTNTNTYNNSIGMGYDKIYANSDLKDGQFTPSIAATDAVADTLAVAVASTVDNILAIQAKKNTCDELDWVYNDIDRQKNEDNEMGLKSTFSPATVNPQRTGEDNSGKRSEDTQAGFDVIDLLDDDKEEDQAELPKLQVSPQSKADGLSQNDNDVSNPIVDPQRIDEDDAIYLLVDSEEEDQAELPKLQVAPQSKADGLSQNDYDVSHPIVDPQRNDEDNSGKRSEDTPAGRDVIDLLDDGKEEDQAELPKFQVSPQSKADGLSQNDNDISHPETDTKSHTAMKDDDAERDNSSLEKFNRKRQNQHDGDTTPFVIDLLEEGNGEYGENESEDEGALKPQASDHQEVGKEQETLEDNDGIIVIGSSSSPIDIDDPLEVEERNEQRFDSLEDDGDIQITGSTGKNALSDYPHPRHECVVKSFTKNPEHFCPNCYCFVCDIKASECTEWKDFHCKADRDIKWRRRRIKTRNKRKAPERARQRLAISFTDHDTDQDSSRSTSQTRTRRTRSNVSITTLRVSSQKDVQGVHFVRNT